MKQFACLLAIVGWTLSSWSQSSFVSPMADPVTISGYPGFALAPPVFLDLDNDGDLDMIRSVQYSNRLVWHPRLDNGNFGAEQNLFDSLDEITELKVTDVNNDGLEDLLMCTYGSKTLYYCERAPNLTLGPPNPIITLNNGPYSLAHGDLNGDGNEDAIALSYSQNELFWIPFENGEFAITTHFISNRTHPTFGTTADVDFDGDVDLLIGHHNGQGTWCYYNNGDGMSWTEEQIIPGGDLYTSFHTFEEEGVFTFFAAQGGDIKYAVHDSAGWQSGILYNPSSTVESIEVEPNALGWLFTVCLNNSIELLQVDGNFSNPETLASNQVGFNFRHLLTDPEPGMGRLLGNRVNPNGVYSMSIGAEFGMEQLTSNNTSNTIPIAWVQADSDSLLEAVARNGNELMLFHYEGNEQWSVGTPILNSMNVTSIDVADIDDDGDDDLLLGSSIDNRMAWIECNGNGSYSALRTISYGIDVTSVKWFDVNQDGLLDITGTDFQNKQLKSWIASPSDALTMVFASSDVLAEFDENISGFRHHEAGDFNGDGVEDMVVATVNETFVGLRNDAGTFDWTQISSGQWNGPLGPRTADIRGISVGDVDNNGFDQVVIATWNDNTVVMDNPSGNPESWTIHTVSDASINSYLASGVNKANQTTDIQLNDINNDGLIDIIECHDATNQDGVFVLENNGVNEWSVQTNILPSIYQSGDFGGGRNIRMTDWRDADGDGDLDMIAAKPYHGEFFFALNQSQMAGCTDVLAVNYESAAALDDGSCVFEGEECNDGLAATYNDQIDANGNCAGQSFEGDNLLRINCGYTTSTVSDSEGNEWQIEQYAIGGGNAAGGGVSGTTDDHIMKYFHYDATGYDLPVPEGGNYLVRLHFAAMRNEVQTEGYEVFHVLLEGDTMESHFDIYAAAGGRQKYIAREYFIETTDDVISLRMPVVSFSNEISGIEVFQYTGDCEDLDLDDVCDDLEVFGCTEADACNYDDDATEDNGTCEFVSCAGCTDMDACNFDAEATYLDASCEYAEVGYDCAGLCLEDLDGDGICDDFEIEGCTYPGASNYMPIATDDDGSCLFDGAPAALGCTYPEACNYDASAGFDDGSCVYPLLGRDCDGICLNDQDGDGICDEFEGCTIPTACNYNAAALDNDGCCIFAEDGADCDGNCLNDIDEDGICDEAELPGCTDPLACNYSQLATDDNGTCFFAADGQDCDGNCLSDLDGDGVCDGDEVEGCPDEAACNYDPAVTNPDGSCTYPDFYYDCAGNCLADADGDGVCDLLEIPGCTYAGAANFSPSATNDDGSCVFGGDAVGGCFYSSACNYDPAATVDDGSCIFPTEGLDCNGECLLDCDGDGICDANEIPGCTDAAACNYLAGATDDLDNCEYLSCAGCMDSEACNYDASAPYEDGSCEYVTCAGCTTAEACNYDATASIEDGSCEFESCVGCTYPEADNYDPTATIDDGSCITTGQLQAVADTAYTSGYDAGVEVTELECEEEVTDAYNEGFLQGTLFGGDGTGSGPTEDACGPGTVWNDLYQLCLPEEVCTGDISGDGAVSVQDILMLLPLFGTTCN